MYFIMCIRDFHFLAYHYSILDRHWDDLLIKYGKWLYYHDVQAIPSFEYYDIPQDCDITLTLPQKTMLPG